MAINYACGAYVGAVDQVVPNVIVLPVRCPGLGSQLIQYPVVQDPVVQDPVVQDPVVQDPVIQDPVIQDPVIQDPVIQDPEQFPHLGSLIKEAWEWTITYSVVDAQGRRVIRAGRPLRQATSSCIVSSGHGLMLGEITTVYLTGWDERVPKQVLFINDQIPSDYSADQVAEAVTVFYLSICNLCLLEGARSLSVPLLGLPDAVDGVETGNAYIGPNASKIAKIARNVFLEADISASLFLPPALFLRVCG